MKKYLYTFLLLFSFSICYAQNNNDVLLTINGQDITVEEFKAVYLKNISLVQDEAQKDPRAYLELFKEYKLKVQEAYKDGLDKNPAYVKELAGYRAQLIKNYLTDVDVTEALIKEAYDRTINEVKARHILVKNLPNASPQDTLKAYTKIIEARKRILAGEDFATIAKEYSEDPSAKTNGGELGWFKAFKMVYPFESAAFTTDVGQVSEPFKTRFGYHIVQTTDKRQARGGIEVAHIMLALKQKDSTLNPAKRIKEIYALLEQGESFEKLAQAHSDDKRSAVKGGKISRFESGQLSSKIFEEQVFSIREKGAYTQPFKSEFGWHIAKLIERFPVGSYEEERAALEEKLTRDIRAKQISDSLDAKLRVKYGVEENIELQKYFATLFTDADFTSRRWKYVPNEFEKSTVALTLNDATYTYANFGSYLERFQRGGTYANKAQLIKKQIFDWTNKTIKKYHEDHFEEVNSEFKALIREYREGLLLFELLETKVWEVAKTDSLGIQNYFTKNIESYRIPETVKMTMITASDKKTLTAVRKLLKKGKSQEEIEQKFNINEQVNVLFTKREVPTNDTTYIASTYTPVKGISKLYELNSDHVLYDVEEIMASRLSSFEETRGAIINDYQKHIEKTWLQGLKESATIEVNEAVLDRFIKTLK
ncbi:peptidyl-prolyl cis-trans isomerase [Dokdonia pacifica]|uniref:Peptidyl-prolyl cis-trans isomerase SurA n=1 Tax=Dokdonia pacifica TaxID=1627892 RepID=A0A238YQE7_9FLAO|nr:peptidylprolyl isomerase [Dokdonia pacifica]GGG10698.1 peptidyl-prolyl cis-trans isomerase [Dokdonia pacifica]SNR73365.1 peptidyl-prolyl cis-trans isomerase SurA [Dokdonia pacifica]